MTIDEETPPAAEPRRLSVRAAVVLANVVVVVTTIAAALGLLGQEEDSSSASGLANSPTLQKWRLESSLGVEIAVPADWETNDLGCQMSDKPTVVRGAGVVLLCLSNEPASKEVAEITTSAAAQSRELGQVDELTQSSRETEIDGLPAVITTGVLADGRFASTLSLPAQDVAVIVRTASEDRTNDIINSTSIVDVDHLGCATQRPPASQLAGPAEEFASPKTRSIAVCYYGGSVSGRLLASAELTGSDASRLTKAMEAAPLGTNPDQPAEECLPPLTPSSDAFLLAQAPDRSITTVQATFSACAGRGLDNGARQAQVTKEIIALFMDPLNTNYSLSDGIPDY